MDYAKTAKEILEHVGGAANVRDVYNCATRLRFTLEDKTLADRKYIENMDEVMAIVEAGGMFQVVIGTNVADVCQEVQELIESKGQTLNGGNAEEQNLFQRFVTMISAVFGPLLHVLGASGIIMGLLSIFTTFHWIDEKGGTYLVLHAICNAFFYYMPVFAAYTAAKKFKANPLLAMTVAGSLIYPNVVEAYSSGVSYHFLGVPLILANYTGQVIPIIVAVYVLSHVERFFRRKLHDNIRNIITPLLCMLIVIPLTLLVLGPICVTLATQLANGYRFIYGINPVIAGVLIGGFWSSLVLFGIHWGFTPIQLNNILVTGRDRIGASIGPATASQTGASLGVFLKTKNKKMKELALSSFISGCFGITEPAIYGVTMPLKKPFIVASFSAAICGGISAAFGASGLTVAAQGFITIPTFIGAGFAGYVIAYVASFILSCVGTYIVGFEEESVSEELKEDKIVPEKKEKEVTLIDDHGDVILERESLYSVTNGEIIPLSEVSDEVFASETLGKGCAIYPDEGKVYAPADGKINMIFPTKHAMGILTNKNAEVLIHVGIDTVQLNGKHFTLHVENGDKVKKGQLLMEFDLDALKKGGFDTIIPVIVSNSKEYQDVQMEHEGKVSVDDKILSLTV